MSDTEEIGTGRVVRRYSRRLFDKILLAFDQACDQGDREIAERLLLLVERMMKRRPVRPDSDRRRNMENLVPTFLHRRVMIQGGDDSRCKRSPAQAEDTQSA